MTPEEEDRNAGVTRDKDGNVLSEITMTDNEPSLNDLVKQKEESDIDVALNLEAENQRGK